MLPSTRAAVSSGRIVVDDLDLILMDKNLSCSLFGLRSESSIIEINGRMNRSTPLPSEVLGSIPDFFGSIILSCYSPINDMKKAFLKREKSRHVTQSSFCLVGVKYFPLYTHQSIPNIYLSSL